ncbi:hypothetical protein HCH15_00975 [Corynebacterium testudinoris]|uniref:Uncharacterized protein n=1 Tax=Corynebacterium testudinoris TaxID=136857 RepID=A0A0G3H6Y8_9CORY|nr:hypothetical protein [Corynebacterium testudinoris]AKK08545.1 hypothetical protein CTEST_05495 [Corynebacterium testudinoris]MBX8994756.1 hypothetical protein [Corynebacterium testudinoris]
MGALIGWGLALFLIGSLVLSLRKRPSLTDLVATWLLAFIISATWKLPWVEVWWIIALLLAAHAAAFAYSCLGRKLG